ncbi:MAG: hypothetical protein QHH80_07945, partial [Anaerolineae bacterium]|nr:hypothetical protein [Anaerolineae bacterium]
MNPITSKSQVLLIRSDPVKPRIYICETKQVLYRGVSQTNFQVREDDIIYVRCKGIKAGSPAEAVVSLVDRYDETTGFRAMERLTGWHASIMAILAARGVVPRGAIPVERAAPGDAIVAEARLRGLEVRSEIHHR